MKRLFKFLVAAATSLSLLIANVPLTQFTVRADGVEYTLSNGFIESEQRDTLEFRQGDTLLPDNSLNILAPGTITVNYMDKTSNSNIHVDKFVINVDDETVFEGTTGSCQITTRFVVDHYNVNQDNEAVLELSSVIKVTVESSVVRNINFKGNGLINGHTEGDPQLVVSGAGNYSMEFKGMPTGFTIANPGGMGTEELGRLVGVTINDDSKKVTARYDECSYSIDDHVNGNVVIVLEGDDTPGGVIEWTNSGCPEDQIQGNIKRNHEEFQNGSARVVGVYKTYEDIGNPDKNIMSDYGIENNGALFDEYNGCLRIENGYWIAFEFTPLPGYQLVEFGGSAPGQAGINISTNEAPNVYYFQMPQGNCHFTARFDTPENIVKINGNSIVNGGAIDVPENEFVGGTAQMTVGSLNSDTRSAYDKNNDVQAALDKDNLEIEEYLSLDLANIYQKANTDEYWENDYHKLTEGDATVTLKVDGKFNPDNNKVYIVHDKDADEGIEIIEAEYDPNTHEITFDTGSFSNFMIATSDEANDIDVKPNDPPKPGDPEPGEPPVPGEEDPGEYVPRFDVAVVDDEPALGNWEGDEKNRFFEHVEIGQAIPGDAEINNALPDDLPEDCKLIYFINGEEVASFGMDEREEPFSPGHFVTFEKITATENTFEVYFNECWVVGIDVIMLDLSLTALDKDGKAIEPIDGSDDSGALIFECGDAGEEDFTYFEIAYPVCPAEVVVKGINDYAIFYLECNEKDMFNTPIGENSIEYPSEDDYIWIGAWGMVPDTESVNFTDSLTKVSAVFDGVSEDKTDDYLLVVSEFDPSEASEEELAAIKKQIAEKGYDVNTFPLGFDITFYDKTGEVHEPGFTVRITLVLKKALDLKDGEKILILHMIDDDNFEIIEAVYSAQNLTLTFETKTFSPFVVMTGTKAAPASVVKTGETVNTTRIVIASLLIGAAAAAGILFIRRRNDEIEKEEQ